MLLARALPAAKIPASACHLYLFTAPKRNSESEQMLFGGGLSEYGETCFVGGN
jgi:hypothetical protein